MSQTFGISRNPKVAIVMSSLDHPEEDRPTTPLGRIKATGAKFYPLNERWNEGFATMKDVWPTR